MMMLYLHSNDRHFSNMDPVHAPKSNAPNEPFRRQAAALPVISSATHWTAALWQWLHVNTRFRTAYRRPDLSDTVSIVNRSDSCVRLQQKTSISYHMHSNRPPVLLPVPSFSHSNQSLHWICSGQLAHSMSHERQHYSWTRSYWQKMDSWFSSATRKYTSVICSLFLVSLCLSSVQIRLRLRRVCRNEENTSNENQRKCVIRKLCRIQIISK